MSINIAAIRFEDGKMMYTLYEDTSDTLEATLSDKLIEHPYLRKKRWDYCLCTTPKNAENAEAATWGMAWNVKACRHCQAILKGLAPYGLQNQAGQIIEPSLEIRDEPEWFKESFNNV
jgi:hypothetical protein